MRSKQSRTRRVRGAACLAASALALAACHPGSGVAYSGGGADCAGSWTDRHDPYAFGLMDRAGGGDDDWCYVDYGPRQDQLYRRVSIPEDSRIGEWQYRAPDMGGISGSIWWKICEERQNDPDYCAGPYNHSI